jgi:ribosomal protein L11 methylase PrmA
MAEKECLVSRFLSRLSPRLVWDLGANVGRFSRLASQQGAYTVAIDGDPAAVEQNYRHARSSEDAHLLPLLVDLTNPSTNLGWAGTERLSLPERGRADLVLALALIHHLAIGNNVPLSGIAHWLSQIGKAAVVEFVPKSDSQVQRLLASRADVFDGYTESSFQQAFRQFFAIESREPIPGTERVLYLLRRL